MHGLPELRIPEDWRRRTRVFVTAAKVRHGLAPLVSREVYAAERSLPATAGPPPPQPAKKEEEGHGGRSGQQGSPSLRMTGPG